MATFFWQQSATAVVCVLFVLGGCSSTKPPAAEVQRVMLGEVTEEGYVLNFELALTNPNTQPLELQEIQYTLAVDGVGVYHGRRSAEATVAAEDVGELIVPGVVRFDQVDHGSVPSSLNYSMSGRLWYMTDDTLAEMLFDANIRRPSMTFATEGDLTFAESE